MGTVVEMGREATQNTAHPGMGAPLTRGSTPPIGAGLTDQPVPQGQTKDLFINRLTGG